MDLEQYAGMSVYAGIQDIMDVAHFSDAEDGTLMDALGEVLCRYGVADILGIALLHTHFPLNDDEILVEGIYPDHVISQPFQLQAIAAHVTPMTWRLVDDSKPVPLHWRVDADPHVERVQTFLRSSAVQELRSLLGNNVERFGLIRISAFEQELNNLSLLEESDTENRILLSKPSTQRENAVQTAWYFSPTIQMAG